MSSKLLIAFVMVLCWNSVKASDFITVDGFKYYVDTTKGEATILANDYEGDIVIPSVVVFEDKDYAVATIGKNAFKNALYSSDKDSTSQPKIFLYSPSTCAITLGVNLAPHCVNK